MRSTLEIRPPLSIPLARDEVAQAGEVLGAGGAAVEVGAHPGDPRLGGLAGDGQLDIAVELLEALLAGQLGGAGAEHPSQDRVAFVVLAHASSSPSVPTRRPRAASAARRLRRAAVGGLLGGAPGGAARAGARAVR